MTTIIDWNTPIALLTIGQLMDFLVMKNEAKQSELPATDARRYVYGLQGIRNLFNVSHVTAHRYKEGILKDAVSQQGRVIITDVDKAMELFNAK